MAAKLLSDLFKFNFKHKRKIVKMGFSKRRLSVNIRAYIALSGVGRRQLW